MQKHCTLNEVPVPTTSIEVIVCCYDVPTTSMNVCKISSKFLAIIIYKFYSIDSVKMYYRELHDDESDYKKEIKRLINMDDAAMPEQFEMPPLGIEPKAFVNKYFGPNTSLPMAQFDKGTTTLAFIYKPKTAADKGGIVVAVDSRATGGQFISSKTIMKILQINDQMVATMAGGAADCQYWVRVLTKYCNLFELREGEPISVAAASQYFANTMYQYRNKGLSIGSMIAGIDKLGPSLYLVQDGGGRLKLPKICAIGSGMMNAMAILDTKCKDEMGDEEALALGREAIMHATYRDAGSGGRCNVCHITPGKMTIYPPMDVSEMFYDFAQKKEIDIVPQMDDGVVDEEVPQVDDGAVGEEISMTG